MAGCNRCGRRADGRYCRDCARDEYWEDEFDGADDEGGDE